MSDIRDLMTTAEDRQWLAAQYVLGELSAVQTEAFDAALAEDSSLCELVIEATQLVSGVLLATTANADRSDKTQTSARLPRTAAVRSKGRTAFVMLSTFSLLGLLVAFLVSSGPESASQLVRDDIATAEALVALLPDEEIVAVDLLSDVDAAGDESVADLVVPEWLLTAIELEQNIDGPPGAEAAEVF